jgi:hypothetical protein
MSMLTPPGMGGKYRVTGTTFPRMRRPSNRRRIVLSAVAGAVVLGVIGWGSVQLFGVFDGDGSGHNAAGDHCAPNAIGTKTGAALPVPNPSAVTVNVYNATDRDGLAARTADVLKQRGFHIGKVGNASAAYDNKVPGTAILLGGPQAQSALKVLGTQLSAGEIKTDAKRAGAADVDLIIGKGFAALDPASNASHALAVLKQPTPTPSGTTCPASARKRSS